MTYYEKLKDPRWQKKRLEIMSRDSFTCVACGRDDKTLTVHHVRYTRDPWDIDNIWLQTLCEDCHKLLGEHPKAGVRYIWLEQDYDSTVTRSLTVMYHHCPTCGNNNEGRLLNVGGEYMCKCGYVFGYPTDVANSYPEYSVMGSINFEVNK
jgi:hypothetical protein